MVDSPQMSTDRWVHVDSHRDDVFYAYGTEYDTTPVDGGYYLSYPYLGIGFDIDGYTDLVRAIVVFQGQE